MKREAEDEWRGKERRGVEGESTKQSRQREVDRRSWDYVEQAQGWTSIIG